MAGSLMAQQAEDAIRYTMMGFGSTSRSLALGGAIGAVGNDPASLAYNPAGIAVNRRHVLNMSLSNTGVRTTSGYLGNSDLTSMNKTNMPSIGLILTGIIYDKKKPAKTGWCNYNLGINITRNSDYARSFFYQGVNRNSSIMDAFAQYANVNRFDKNYIISDGGSPENLALQTGLIDNYPVFDTIQKLFINNYAPVYKTGSYAPGKGPVFLQSGTGQVYGKFSEVDISFGGNYGNKLFLGATMAIGIIRYSYTYAHTDQDSGNRIAGFKSLTYTQNNQSKGASVGLKLGAIYRVTDAFRVGFAWHSAQVFNMKDNYNFKLSTTSDGGLPQSVATDQGGFYSIYHFRMPSRIIFSTAYVMDKAGLISADFEIPNYKSASFADSMNVLRDRNRVIDTTYRMGAVFRLGGEVYLDRFFLRAGLALYGSPFSNKSDYANANQSSKIFCLGGGYHGEQFSLDVGYGYMLTKEFYTPYALEQSNSYASAVNAVGSGKLVITAIRRF